MSGNVGGDLNIRMIPGTAGVEWTVNRGNVVVGNIFKKGRKYYATFFGTILPGADDFQGAKAALFKHLRDAHAQTERRLELPEFSDSNFRSQMTVLYYFLWHEKLSPLKVIEAAKAALKGRTALQLREGETVDQPSPDSSTG